ncbi:MAG: Ig-like domain-containing protein [Chloroflexota bacterium]
MDSFDRLVLGVIAALVLAVGLVVALGDHVAARIASVAPAEGSTPPVTTSISIDFGQPMDVDSVESRLSISPPVDGVTHWEGTRLVFVPATPLAAGQTYQVTLEAGAVSERGRRLAESVAWAFEPRSIGFLYLSPADGDVRSLWYRSLDGQEARQVFAPSTGVFDYASSPDSTQVAVAVFDEAAQGVDMWLIDLEEDQPRKIINCAPGLCISPAFSPDGSLIAYERQEPAPDETPGPSRVWLYDVASGETSPVFEDDQVLGVTPSWSDDGGALAFYDANVQGIRVVDLADGSSTIIPSLLGETGDFAPDGSRMVYTDIRRVGRQYYTQVWLADLGDEGGVSPLVEEPEEDSIPVWSPDGKWVAFARRRLDRQGGRGSQLMLVDPATGDLRQVTGDVDYNNTAFAWDLSGQRILVQRYDISGDVARAEIWLYDTTEDDLSLLVENALGGRWLP